MQNIVFGTFWNKDQSSVWAKKKKKKRQEQAVKSHSRFITRPPNSPLQKFWSLASLCELIIPLCLWQEATLIRIYPLGWSQHSQKPSHSLTLWPRLEVVSSPASPFLPLLSPQINEYWGSKQKQREPHFRITFYNFCTPYVTHKPNTTFIQTHKCKIVHITYGKPRWSVSMLGHIPTRARWVGKQPL